MRKIFFLLSLMLISSAGRGAPALQVSAAISLRGLLEKVANEYSKRHPEIKIAFNFAGSPELTRQIQAGAPVDIFVAADEVLLKDLETTGRLDQHFSFVRNELSLIAPSKQPFPQNAEDLRQAKIKKIAMGEPKAAAGRYAYAYLEKAKLLSHVKGRLVYLENVRAVFNLVAQGQANAGFVYVTDFKALNQTGEVRLVERLDPKFYPTVIYPACLLKNLKTVKKEAKEFFNYLKSPEVKGMAKEFGFAL